MSDYALFVSIASILISIGALVWNVWQKYIFVKPALQVSFGIWRVVQPDTSANNRRLLNLTITNLGPGPVVLYACIAKEKHRWWKRVKTLATLNPIHGDPLDPNPTGIGPFGGGLPAKIDASEVKSFYFPYNEECLLQEGVTCVGINDTYQRNTWCRRSDMRKVYQAYKQDFEKP
jgi:hypothetical protein